MNICKVNDCKIQVHGLGYCHKHWRRFKKHGNPLFVRQKNEICKKNYPVEFKTWQCIKQRCYNLKVSNYHRYGGRGIIICNEWINNFESFFRSVGPVPFKGAHIDRKDNDGNYESGNCRWVTPSESAHNRSTNKVSTSKVKEIREKYKNEKISQNELALMYGVSQSFISRLINNKRWAKII